MAHTFNQDVDVLQEASGHDKEFEKKLLDAYQQTCLPHLAALEAALLQARRKEVRRCVASEQQ